MPTNYILTVNFTEQGINTLKQANEQVAIVRLSVYLLTLPVRSRIGIVVQVIPLLHNQAAFLMFTINPVVRC